MTTEERLEVLERELAHAKRRNRWLLFVTLAAIGLLAAVVLGYDRMAMQMGVRQVITCIVLVISGGMGYIFAVESGRPRFEGPIIFMGKEGQLFISLLGTAALAIYVAASAYLWYTSGIWVLLRVLLINVFVVPLLSRIVWWMVGFPIYMLYHKLYEFFHPDE